MDIKRKELAKRFSTNIRKGFEKLFAITEIEIKEKKNVPFYFQEYQVSSQITWYNCVLDSVLHAHF